MEEYKVYEKAHPIGDGTQKVYRFPNGYGASVIRFMIHIPFSGLISGSYGADEGKWELALIKFDGADNNSHEVVYEHGYDDVIGYLSDEEVESHLAQIKGIEVVYGK
jgi:hypothetical protein